MGALTLFEGKQLDLIRRTVAKDCDAAEFDMFMHICKSVSLDPLRRQIYAFVFGKNDSDKRRMTVVTAIDGYRAIAARTENYRPDDKAPRIEYSESLKCPSKNPLGIVRAEVTVYKFAHGSWHPVTGEAYWDEYAPIIETGDGGSEWVATGQLYPEGHAKAGKPKYRKQPIGDVTEALDPLKSNWRKMARVMISKCAEAQAIRRAWPDDFAGLEVEEEVDRRASIDLTASEMADEAASQARLARIGGPSVTVDWCEGGELSREPIGTFADKVFAFIKANADSPMTVLTFRQRNAPALLEYWGHDKNGALALKAAFEPFETAV